MIRDNLVSCQERCAAAARRSGRDPGQVALVAVTKGVGLDRVEEAVAAGVTHVGENRIQETLLKYERLNRYARERGAALRWHLVGHLQTNKVSDAVRLFDVIHSVDSARLAEAIEKRAGQMGKVQEIFLEVNVSGEASKYGWGVDEVAKALPGIASLPHVRATGLMTVAPQADDAEQARPFFRRLRELRDALSGPRTSDLGLRELSMGMTDDFEVAVEEGATFVRLGRALFGERP